MSVYNKFKRDYVADYSFCDYTGNLSIRSMSEIIESSVASNFGLMGCDNLTLRTKYDAMWVFVKNDIHINGYVKWNEGFKVESYCVGFKKLKCIIETDLINDNGEVFAYSVLECCCLDVNTHQLRKLDTIPFPMDYDIYNAKEYSYTGKITADYTLVENVKVRSQDVDYSRHLNNVNYIKYILNTYSVDELVNMTITNIELYYIRETVENSDLSIYKYKEDDRTIFSIKNGDIEVFSMHMRYNQIN